MTDIKQYLEETNTVLLTKEAFECLKERACVLDKIRAEIEHVIDYTYDSTNRDKSLYNGAYKDGLYEVLDIIDKYKAESGDK